MQSIAYLSVYLRRSCSVLGLLIAIVPLVGCGPRAPFDYVKVSGKVIYEDGTPVPEGIRVGFVSQMPSLEGDLRPRPAYGFTNENGEFAYVTSQKPGDGIVPGEHKVLVVIEAENPTRVIPAEYGQVKTTPLTVQAEDSPFELRIRKP